MKKLLFLVLSFFLFIPSSLAEEGNLLAPSAKSAILIEASTGEILYEFNSHEKLAPASMTKMMSLLLIMEAIEKGSITYDTKVMASKNASDMGGSQILLEEGESMSVDDLLKGITIASGNDAVVAMAEAIGGSEANFVAMMNEKVKELGLKDTHFQNSHGLDTENHYSSAYDMAMIARELVRHEKILEYSSIYETYLRTGTDRQTWLVNTNKLVRFKEGVDGLKTGYTENSLYCLTATMKKDGMRVIAVVMGEPSTTTRNAEASSMLDYAFAQYGLQKLLSKDSVVDTISLAKSKKESVAIMPMEDVSILYKKMEKKITPTYEISYGKINSKIEVGEKVGTLTIKDGSKTIRTVDLTVAVPVKKANVLDLLLRYGKNLITGNIHFQGKKD